MAEFLHSRLVNIKLPDVKRDREKNWTDKGKDKVQDRAGPGQHLSSGYTRRTTYVTIMCSL